MPTARIETQSPAEDVHPPRVASPCAFVIFGATGDLTHRKLMPAIYRLRLLGSITDRFAVVGVARRPLTPPAFAAGVAQALGQSLPAAAVQPERVRAYADGLTYVAGDFAEADTYARLKDALGRLDRERGLEGNRLFYLATPPAEFETILGRLAEAGLIAPPHREPWTRVVIEKPFGRDLTSALELNRLVARVLDETQTFRIDHYLGKETVQNILGFRFANSIFEPLWNRKSVAYVEICAAETRGVGTRGKFYDATGVLRDIVQNHLLEVLCLTAMEPPTTGEADDVRTEKLKVLHALREPWAETIPRDVALGQYRGYPAEPDVSPDSTTPTFAALRVFCAREK